MADIVVTRQNGAPYIGTVLAANPEGPFVLLNYYDEVELTGEKNNKVECGEVIALDGERAQAEARLLEDRTEPRSR